MEDFKKSFLDKHKRKVTWTAAFFLSLFVQWKSESYQWAVITAVIHLQL